MASNKRHATKTNREKRKTHASERTEAKAMRHHLHAKTTTSVEEDYMASKQGTTNMNEDRPCKQIQKTCKLQIHTSPKYKSRDKSSETKKASFLIDV